MEKQDTQWTVGTLKEYLDKEIVALKSLSNERLQALKDVAAEKEEKQKERFASQQEAIKVADARLQEYKAQANEWRGQSKDRETNFLSVAEHIAFEKGIEDKLVIMHASLDKLNSWKENSQGRLSIITWGVGIGVTVLIGIAIAMITQAIKVH